MVVAHNTNALQVLATRLLKAETINEQTDFIPRGANMKK
jgi:hypothetical protein